VTLFEMRAAQEHARIRAASVHGAFQKADGRAGERKKGSGDNNDGVAFERVSEQSFHCRRKEERLGESHFLFAVEGEVARGKTSQVQLVFVARGTGAPSGEEPQRGAEPGEVVCRGNEALIAQAAEEAPLEGWKRSESAIQIEERGSAARLADHRANS
jgi:hypothetical protein